MLGGQVVRARWAATLGRPGGARLHEVADHRSDQHGALPVVERALELEDLVVQRGAFTPSRLAVREDVGQLLGHGGLLGHRECPPHDRRSAAPVPCPRRLQTLARRRAERGRKDGAVHICQIFSPLAADSLEIIPLLQTREMR